MPNRSNNPADQPRFDNRTPLYNSGILGNYIHYLESHHVEIDTEELLHCCGLTRYDVNDKGLYLTQDQVNAFHRCLNQKLPDPEIAYKVGQYALYLKSTETVMQYGFQFITPETMYKAIDHIYTKWSKGHLCKTTIPRRGRADVTVRTLPGVHEEPFQCRNRQGTFEAVASIQTGRPAEINHTTCMHRGDDACRYQITWKEKPSAQWKRSGRLAAVMAALMAGISFFMMSGAGWVLFALAITVVCLAILLCGARMERNELARFLKEQGDAASQLIDEIEVRHHNAQLIQEIGQAGADILEVNAFLETVLTSMARNLEFNRGMIALYDQGCRCLRHTADYGFSTPERECLAQIEYRIDIENTSDLFIQALTSGRPIIMDDLKGQLPRIAFERFHIIESLGITSLISVPVIHKKEPLGLLFVDTSNTRRMHTTSDVNLLVGIAAQVATGIVNARSYAQIQESEHRYRLLAENVMDVIWILDVDSLKLRYVSPSVEKVLGYSPEEIITLSIDHLLTPAAYEKAIEALSETLARFSGGDNQNQRESFTLELEEIHKNGTIVPIEVTAGLLLDDTGTPNAVLGISRDLSRRKIAEREREEIENRLQQAKKMESLGTMAGSIAHNFNNLLMVVLGNLELAREDLPEAAPALINIKRALNASQRAADLSGMMLTYVGQLKKESVPLDLSQTARLVLSNLDESTMANVNLDLDLADPMPLVAADASQMRQLIAGFVTNAIEALEGKAGRVRISTGSMHCDRNYLSTTYLKEERPEGLYAYVEVADNGCGMDVETLGKVFDPFFSTKFTGRGLGMAAVLGIVRSHNGAVRVRSVKGEGSVFTALFPIQGISLDVSDGGREVRPSLTAGKTVLIVDDEEMVMEIGKQFLQRLGYTVETATSGQAAIDIVDRGTPIDCMLIDYTMPVLDGIGTIREIRAIRPDARIIITSGYTRQQIEDRFTGIGLPDEFIQKPFQMKTLQEKLQRVILR